MQLAGWAGKRWVTALLTMLVLGACAGRSVIETAPPHASFALDSTVLGEVRQINVYLPPQQAGRRYPVIYMPDGGVAEDFPHVATAVDTAIREGRLAPVILVGIENTLRRRDMTGPTSVAADREIAAVIGGSAQFRGFIARELIPFVEASYPTNGQRGIIGESLAGLFVVETLFQSPGLFDTFIALDPSLWWDGGRLAADTSAWLDAHSDIQARLYVGWAEPEMIGREVQVLERSLRAAALSGLKWQVQARTDLSHQTIYRALAPEVLPAMYPPK